MSIILGLLSILGITSLLGYFYIVIWVMPQKQERLQELSWLCWLCVFVAVIAFASAGAITSIMVRTVFPLFIFIALIIGLILRQSAISPYELSEYWLRRAKKKKGQNKQ